MYGLFGCDSNSENIMPIYSEDGASHVRIERVRDRNFSTSGDLAWEVLHFR